jgi:hypothetical protein
MRNAIIFVLVMVGAVAGGLVIGFLTADQPQVAQQAEAPPTAEEAVPPSNPAEDEKARSATEASSYEPAQFERRPAPEPTPSTPLLEESEAALASADMAMLAHVDFAVLAQVERAYFGAGDPDALPPPLLDPHDLRQQLATHGVDLGKSLDHVIFGLYGRGGEVGGVAVMLGRIPTEELRPVLTEIYQVEERETDHGKLLWVTHRDERSCRLEGPVALSIAADRLIVGTPWAVEAILARMRGKAAAVKDLHDWRELRSSKVFSFATFASPEDLARDLAQDPMSGAVLSASENELPHIESLTGGLSLQALPFQADLTLTVTSDDPQWAQSQASAFRQGQEALHRDYGADLPALARLSDRVSLTSEDARIAISVGLDEATVQEIGNLVGEAFKAAFMGMGGGTMLAAPADSPQAEELADRNRLTHYRKNISLDQLLSFAELEDKTMEPDAESGPFGVRVAAARLYEDDPSLLEVVVEVASAGLPNLPEDAFHALESRPTAALAITGISGAGGQDLLREEDCGEDRNNEATSLEFRDHSVYTGSDWKTERRAAGQKTLRLTPSARLEDVERIEGEVRLNLATETETHRLTAPFAGQVIEAHGLRVQLRESGDGSVSYSVSGETDRLLAVRGLNATGQELASAGTSGSGSLGGFEKLIERDFKGKVRSAEFVIASTFATKVFPFAMTSALPRFSEWDFPEPVEVETARAADLRDRALPEKKCEDTLATSEAAPFRFCLDHVSHFFGPHYQIGVTTLGPEFAPLIGNVSGAELRLDRLRLSDDREMEIDAGAFAELRWDSFENATKAQNYISLELPNPVESDDIAAVEGRLLVRVPTAFDRISLESIRPGSSASGPNGTTMRLLGFENGNLELELTGERARLVQFRARVAENGLVSTRTHQLDDGTANGDASWEATVATSGYPSMVEAVFASDQDVLEFPFELRRQP